MVAGTTAMAGIRGKGEPTTSNNNPINYNHNKLNVTTTNIKKGGGAYHIMTRKGCSLGGGRWGDSSTILFLFLLVYYLGDRLWC